MASLLLFAGALAVAALLAVIVLAARRPNRFDGPEADYDDAPRRPAG